MPDRSQFLHRVIGQREVFLLLRVRGGIELEHGHWGSIVLWDCSNRHGVPGGIARLTRFVAS